MAAAPGHARVTGGSLRKTTRPHGRRVMSESENVEILKRAYAAFSQGDIAGLLQMYAPDAEQDFPAVKDIPWTGSWHGRTEMSRFFDTIAQAEEVLDFRQHEFIA